MRVPMKLAFSLLTVMTWSTQARASGFHVDEQDARGTGRAGAVTANPGNASAIYYNPAGIALLNGMHLDGGVTLVTPRSRFTPDSGSNQIAAETETFPLPHGYVSYRASDLLSFGVGANAPFGLSLRWPAVMPARTNVRYLALESFFITPTVGLNLGALVPGLSFGAGLDLVPASVRLERDILFGSDMASVALSGRAFGVGARAGLLYRVPGNAHLAFGLTYRSPVSLDFSGTANFSASPIYRSSLPPDGDASTSVTLPQGLNFGVSIMPLRSWEIELDADWLGWSVYKNLTLKLPGNQTSTTERGWKDTITLRLGSELAVSQVWTARVGVAFDKGAVPNTSLDFQLPDADRWLVGTGIGAALSPMLRADLAGMVIVPTNASTSIDNVQRPPAKGTYDIAAWILSATLGVALPL